MPRLLVCQHVPYEILGTLNPLLKSAGFRIRYVNFGRYPDAEPSLDGYHGLVILGGPMSVNDTGRHPHLTTELKLIEQAMNRGIPVLGICLGAQLIAQALGAEVASTGKVEIGFGPLTLTDEGRASVLKEIGTVPVLHWHGDQFAIPAGAQRLAQTPGFPHQAFAIDRHVLGLQFHLEVEATQLERWLIGHAHELATHGIDPNQLRRDATEHGAVLLHAAGAIFDAWLQAV